MDTLAKKVKSVIKKSSLVSSSLFASWFGVETPDVPKIMGLSDAMSVVDLVNAGLTFIAGLGGVVAVALILYGGFLYV
jgi:hypothetical protein